MGRILNKMYIMSGGVTGEDKLSSYRFLTMKMLNTTPQWGYVSPLFDEALEVDSTLRNPAEAKKRVEAYYNA